MANNIDGIISFESLLRRHDSDIEERKRDYDESMARMCRTVREIAYLQLALRGDVFVACELSHYRFCDDGWVGGWDRIGATVLQTFEPSTIDVALYELFAGIEQVQTNNDRLDGVEVVSVDTLTESTEMIFVRHTDPVLQEEGITKYRGPLIVRELKYHKPPRLFVAPAPILTKPTVIDPKPKVLTRKTDIC